MNRYLFKDDLITAENLIEASESLVPASTSTSAFPVASTTSDQIDFDSIEPFVEPINKKQQQQSTELVANNIFNTEGVQSPITTTGPTAESSTKKRPRKRTRNEKKWQKNVAKKMRLQGKPYQSKVAKKNKIVEARSLKPSCKCRAECFKKLSEEQRVKIFESFWSDCNNWDQRRQYIADRVTKTAKLRTRVNSSFEEDKRKYNYNYSLQVNDNIISVCKVMFLNTHSIGEKYVKITVAKKNDNGLTEPDKRGSHSNKTKDTVIQSVKDHISSLPSYESHYSREKSKRRYLGPELNITLMYKLYKEKMAERGIIEENQAKEWLYREIFNTMFNLSF